jgi:hypothetical protein
MVDRDGIVRAGNGTLQAAKSAGFTKVQVVDADRDTLIAVRRNDLSAAEATAYAITDNKTAELGAWDNSVLGDILAGLCEEGDGTLLSVLGFTDRELQKICAAQEPVVLDTGVEVEQIKAKRLVIQSCPKCGFQWEPR